MDITRIKRTTYTEVAREGFARRHPKYRVAFSYCPELWDPKERATSKEYFALRKNGLAGVSHTSGPISEWRDKLGYSK